VATVKAFKDMVQVPHKNIADSTTVPFVGEEERTFINAGFFSPKWSNTNVVVKAMCYKPEGPGFETQ
jgi:hypothetical protein